MTSLIALGIDVKIDHIAATKALNETENEDLPALMKVAIILVEQFNKLKRKISKQRTGTLLKS